MGNRQLMRNLHQWNSSEKPNSAHSFRLLPNRPFWFHQIWNSMETQGSQTLTNLQTRYNKQSFVITLVNNHALPYVEGL